MPLSEYEQRQLEQIEKALAAEDPKFADRVRAPDPRGHHRRKVILAAAGFLLGLGLLLAGVVTGYTSAGVAGFLAMLGCGLQAVTSWRHLASIPPGRSRPA